MSEARVAYRTKPVQSEADLQQSVRELLTMEHILFYEFAPPNSRAHCPKCGAVVGDLAGAVPEGWADLLVILSSVRPVSGGYQWRSEPCYIHLELKSLKGKPSKGQLKRRAEIHAQGGHWYEVRTIEEVAGILARHGHRLRTGGLI